MAWAYVLRPPEMAEFRRCRRAWDLGARIRQSYVPAVPSRAFDFDKAIHDALAVYYFPAMDDWDRAIVRPLALKGFRRSLEQDRSHYGEVADLTDEQERDFAEALEVGEDLLNRYFTWAAPLDTFASIFSDQEYWAPIPDLANPGSDQVDAEGHELRLLGRVDQLFSDPNDEYWIADHRVVRDAWTDDDQLLLDVDGLTAVWATEQTYPQLRIAGTVYNELRVDTVEGDAAASSASAALDALVDDRTMQQARHVHTRRSPVTPDEAMVELETALVTVEAPGRTVEGYPVDYIVARETSGGFRRTYVRRGQTSIRNAGLLVSAEAAIMSDPGVAVYPSPSRENCSGCDFRAPCLAMQEGADAGPVLRAAFRPRTEEEGEEERLRWSIGRAQTRASMSGRDSQPTTVNFHWG